MPTKHRRRAITETPPVRAALDELQGELGEERVELGELVLLGAEAKLAEVRAGREEGDSQRARLAERVRGRRVPVSPEAAEEVRSGGWARG